MVSVDFFRDVHGLVSGLLTNNFETDADGNVVFSKQYVDIAVTAILWSLPLVTRGRGLL